MFRTIFSLRFAAPALVLTAALAGCADQPSRDSYVVFFDSESVALSPNAQTLIARAATAARNENATLIRVSGSAGVNGDPSVLKELADTRAQVVAAELSKDGVNGAKVEIKPETGPTIDASHVALRRVSITINPSQ